MQIVEDVVADHDQPDDVVELPVERRHDVPVTREALALRIGRTELFPGYRVGPVMERQGQHLAQVQKACRIVPVGLARHLRFDATDLGVAPGLFQGHTHVLEHRDDGVVVEERRKPQPFPRQIGRRA